MVKTYKCCFQYFQRLEEYLVSLFRVGSVKDIIIILSPTIEPNLFTNKGGYHLICYYYIYIS